MAKKTGVAMVKISRKSLKPVPELFAGKTSWNQLPKKLRDKMELQAKKALQK